jgi:hypothetical protein
MQMLQCAFLTAIDIALCQAIGALLIPSSRYPSLARFVLLIFPISD